MAVIPFDLSPTLTCPISTQYYSLSSNLFVFLFSNRLDMEKLTIKIDTKNNKGKYLYRLITEMAKEGSFLEIQKEETVNEVKTALREMKAGKRNPINELFK